MGLSLIAGAILAYLVVMLLVHEIFKKFFHMIFFVSAIAFLIGLLYFMTSGV